MKTLMVMIALGASIVSAPAVAQGLGGGGQRDQTRAEAQQRADLIFQMIDSNHDGVVTRDEAQQAAAQLGSRGGDNGRGGGRMQRMIDQAFGNSPSLTLQQFEAKALARFDAEDLNHDGVLTAAERQQAREMRQGEGAQGQAPAPVPEPVQPHQ